MYKGHFPTTNRQLYVPAYREYGFLTTKKLWAFLGSSSACPA